MQNNQTGRKTPVTKEIFEEIANYSHVCGAIDDEGKLYLKIKNSEEVLKVHSQKTITTEDEFFTEMRLIGIDLPYWTFRF